MAGPRKSPEESSQDEPNQMDHRQRDEVFLRMLQEQAEKLDTMAKTLVGAFPGGDGESHRRYHELVIKREERKEKLHQAIIEKTLTSLIWALLVSLALAVWNSLKQRL